MSASNIYKYINERERVLCMRYEGYEGNKGYLGYEGEGGL